MDTLYPTNWEFETTRKPKKQSLADMRLSDLCALLPTREDKDEGLENLRLLKRVYLQFSKGQPFCDAGTVWREMQRRDLGIVALPEPTSGDAELEQIFSGLVATWQEETGGLSSTTRRYAHRSYQAILGLGSGVIPLILKELNNRPDWWFEALSALAKPDVNPVKPGMTFEQAVAAWNEWAK